MLKMRGKAQLHARLAIVTLFFLFQPTNIAFALAVEDTTGTTVAPADDPGWASVTKPGRSGIYLGDSWVLTARHVHAGTVKFDDATLDAIPDQEWEIANLPTWDGDSIAALSDLLIFRVDGDLGTPDVTIASTSLVPGDDIVMIADGRNRVDDMTAWYVDEQEDPWTWSETPGSGLTQYNGYKRANNSSKRWGTNQVGDSSSDLFAAYGIENNWNGVIELSSIVDQISKVTIFDQNGDLHETHALGGDSGGAVFHKRDGSWELAGILHAILPYPGQDSTFTVYGNGTFFSDLAVYRDEILAIIAANPEYSIIGDLDLDGDIDSDDLDEFVRGWGTDQAEHNIETWKTGDLDLDGDTDLYDFALLRNAYPAASQIAALLGVPEPSSSILLILSGIGLMGVRRRLGSQKYHGSPSRVTARRAMLHKIHAPCEHVTE